MICYKDRTFCADDCNNMECGRNKKLIDAKDLKASGLYTSWASFKDTCKHYIKPKERKN